jgi:hypothetical protein
LKTIKQGDADTLNDSTWLNDAAINSYGAHLRHWKRLILPSTHKHCATIIKGSATCVDYNGVFIPGMFEDRIVFFRCPRWSRNSVFSLAGQIHIPICRRKCFIRLRCILQSICRSRNILVHVVTWCNMY